MTFDISFGLNLPTGLSGYNYLNNGSVTLVFTKNVPIIIYSPPFMFVYIYVGTYLILNVHDFYTSIWHTVAEVTQLSCWHNESITIVRYHCPWRNLSCRFERPHYLNKIISTYTQRNYYKLSILEYFHIHSITLSFYGHASRWVDVSKYKLLHTPLQHNTYIIQIYCEW